MGCVYKRGRKLWVKFKNARGQWAYASSGYDVGQEALAREVLDRVEGAISRTTTGPAAGASERTEVPTLATFTASWLAERAALGIRQ